VLLKFAATNSIRQKGMITHVPLGGLVAAVCQSYEPQPSMHKVAFSDGQQTHDWTKETKLVALHSDEQFTLSLLFATDSLGTFREGYYPPE